MYKERLTLIVYSCDHLFCLFGSIKALGFLWYCCVYVCLSCLYNACLVHHFDLFLNQHRTYPNWESLYHQDDICHLTFSWLILKSIYPIIVFVLFDCSQEKQKHEAGTDLWKLWSRKTNQWFSLMPDWIVPSFFKMKFIQYLGIWNPIKRTDTLPPMSS